MTTPIPSPPGLPLVGNAFDIDPQDQLNSLMHLADIYGPIFRLRLPGDDMIVIANHELYDEICDEKRFTKTVAGALTELRVAIHDGLFTAYTGEHNWDIAHRILVPEFGPLAIKDMFNEMHEILTQLVLKWARYGSENRIDVAADFTRLALDSIAICAMDTRFNSFYRETTHPFPQAMSDVLVEAGRRALRPSILNRLMRSSESKYHQGIEVMRNIALGIVAERRKNPVEKKDLVNAMLNKKDPKTGEKMTDDSIADNMITFLIAGHETTAGLLAFLLYHFVNNPEYYIKAQKEVDEVIGTEPINLEHLSKLPYITACLRETLRVTPTIAGGIIGPVAGSTDPILLGGGKYLIKPDQKFRLILPKIMQDPEVYGEDADKFRPERMVDEEFNKLPKNAWKPFGNGARACIGRAFAWQEAMLATAMLLQVFDFRFDDPSYKLTIKQTLTIKPKDLFMHATLRKHLDPINLEKMISGGKLNKAEQPDTSNDEEVGKKSLKQLLIFFGGNMGTCESLAQTVARSSPAHGFSAEVRPLDDATNTLPKNQPILIITASYEGEPPDNANRFVKWLQNYEGPPMNDVNYAVFGCGNRDWRSTFHRIPKLVDSLLEKNGAKRVADSGLVDVANNDIFNDFEKWEDTVFWPPVKNAFGVDKAEGEKDGNNELEVEIFTTLRPTHLHQDVKEAIVLKNETLTSGESPKRHIELKLPTDMEYRAGDYLAVLPMNPDTVIRRVMRHFGLPWDANMTIKSGGTSIPTGIPIAVYVVLKAYVELSQPATLRDLKTFINSTPDGDTKTLLEDLARDSFAQEITDKRVTALDLLEKYPEISPSFGEYLSMLPQLRLRQYSISSSPLADPNVCSLTMGVLNEEAIQGGKRFLGVASNYLSELQEGDHIHVNVKKSHQSFHLPLNPAETPIIMICAGTGLAPFRGFVQERMKQIEGGRDLAPAILFIGCQHPRKDCIYHDELASWSSKGAVDIRYAYSRNPESSNGAKYVQDRFWDDREDITQLFYKGAKFFICGHGRVAEGVDKMLMKMHMKAMEERGTPESEKDAENWLVGLRNERFMSDVFD